MEIFREWVQEMNLIDLPLMGRKFTWARNGLASRIDRMLVDSVWISKFPNMELWDCTNNSQIMRH